MGGEVAAEMKQLLLGFTPVTLGLHCLLCKSVITYPSVPKLPKLHWQLPHAFVSSLLLL